MIVESIRSYGNLIQIDSDGVVYVNRETTEYRSLEEARTYIKNKQVSNTLESQITKDTYEEITDNRIASIIKEYHNIKVTDTLIESYIELASSQIFTIDPIVQKIRSLNKLDAVIEGKLHYELTDGSVVAINERTQKHLNNLLNNQKEIVDYMRESKEKFFQVIKQIEEN
jgi:hypothetical protein